MHSAPPPRLIQCGHIALNHATLGSRAVQGHDCHGGAVAAAGRPASKPGRRARLPQQEGEHGARESASRTGKEAEDAHQDGIRRVHTGRRHELIWLQETGFQLANASYTLRPLSGVDSGAAVSATAGVSAARATAA